jgi:hypothetical protein
MSKPPKLELIKKPPELKGSSTFWDVCPRLLEFLPTTPCEEGKPATDEEGRVLEEPRCPWWINHEGSNYCFWRFVQDRSTPEGVMEELTLAEIAQLFGWSSSRMTTYYKEAQEELKGALEEIGWTSLSDLNQV